MIHILTFALNNLRTFSSYRLVIPSYLPVTIEIDIQHYVEYLL